MAPECLYVQGGLSKWADAGGSWLPVIEQLRDDLDLLMVQLYNTGDMYDLDGVVRAQGNATFIVAMTEAVIRGFTHVLGWGDYSGLPASKVAVALPSCSSAAGGGVVSSTDMVAAMKYLQGTGPKAGSYTLKKLSGYPDLRGLMTWSINNDQSTSCGGASYSFADAAEQAIGTIGVEEVKKAVAFTVFPNPATSTITVQQKNTSASVMQIVDNQGKVVFTSTLTAASTTVDVSPLATGFYAVVMNGTTQKLLIK